MSNDNIREPDKPVIETLIATTTDFIANLNDENYDEELYLKKALDESLQNAEDEYIAFQLEQIKNNEDNIDSSNNSINTKYQENKLIIEERTKLLENILHTFNKLKKIDVNFNENLIILDSIIKRYINCEIDNYKITPEIYNKIFEQLQNIRIKEDELNLIKKIILKLG